MTQEAEAPEIERLLCELISAVEAESCEAIRKDSEAQVKYLEGRRRSYRKELRSFRKRREGGGDIEIKENTNNVVEFKR